MRPRTQTPNWHTHTDPSKPGRATQLRLHWGGVARQRLGQIVQSSLSVFSLGLLGPVWILLLIQGHD